MVEEIQEVNPVGGFAGNTLYVYDDCVCDFAISMENFSVVVKAAEEDPFRNAREAHRVELLADLGADLRQFKEMTCVDTVTWA